MWFTVLIIAIIVGAILGFLGSNDGERGEGALEGACVGGIGCAHILFRILIFGLIVFAFIWLFGALFG